MNVLDHAKVRATRLRLELISVERFIEQYHEFAAEAANQPQAVPSHTPAWSEPCLAAAAPASEGAHNPTSDAPHSAQAEVPEAAASEHPEAHSMATGGKQDAGAVASGHENADPPRSAGGSEEIDASTAAPNTETTGPQPSAGEAARPPASPAPKLTENQRRVVEAHEAHPDMGVTALAKHLGLGPGTVSRIVRRLKIELAAQSHGWGGARARPDSLASRIRAYAQSNPEATAKDCAEAFGEPVERIKNNAAVNKIRFARAPKGRPSKPAAETRKPDPAPAPAPQAKPAPVESYARTRPGSVIMPRAQSIPTGKQFWLKNDAGQYLNRFCLGFTSDRREAWTGNESQLAGCRRNFSIATDLREWPVEKEQPAARQYA